MNEIKARFFSALLVAAVVPTLASEVAHAQRNDLFSGKRIVMIIGENPGGGTDTFGRIFGERLVKYLPGRPTIVFENMQGAGGIKATNYTYVQAPPDGLTLVEGGGNAFDPVRLKLPSVKYDALKFEYVVAFANPSSLLLISREAEKKLHNNPEEKLSMAATDGTRSSEQMSLWGGVALGWNFRLITGYGGTAAMLLALQRGEVDMAANNFYPSIKPMVADGKFLILAQTGDFGGGNVHRSSEFPDIPTVKELVADKLTGQDQQGFKLWQGRSVIGKWFALPPGTPAEYVEAYREASAKVMRDNNFQEKALKSGGNRIQEITAQELFTLVEDMVKTSDDTISYFDSLVKRYRK